MTRGKPPAKPPWWLRLAKLGTLAIANAAVTVALKQVLSASGVLDRIGDTGGGWLKTNLELAFWMFALAVSLMLTGLLLWFLSRRPGHACDTEAAGAGSHQPADMDAGLRAHFLREAREDLEGRLKASIHHARFIELGIEDDPLAVNTPWVYRAVDEKKTYANIWDAFTASRRRLLILGHPGAGKTTALLHIALRLVEEAERDPNAPLPLVANLSKFRLTGGVRTGWLSLRGWRPSPDTARSQAADFEEWLAGEISTVPGVDRNAARGWLASGRIAPLLDGLDEFNDDRRPELARMINTQFLQKHGAVPVVICSRTNEYELLKRDAEGQLRLTGSVQLQPLSDSQISEYLRAAKAEALLAALPHDPALEELSRTPLTLSMLVLAYGGEAPYMSSSGESLSAARFRLFESYVARMLQRQARRDNRVPFDDVRSNDVPVSRYRYRPSGVDRWLGWLALVLSLRMRTTFAPSALVRLLLIGDDPRRQPTAYVVARASAALLFGVPLVLVAFVIVPPAMEAVATAALTLLAAWLLAPLVATINKEWWLGMITGFALIAGAATLAIAIVSQTIATHSWVQLPATAVVPALVAGWIGLFSVTDEYSRGDGFVWLGAAAASAVGAKAGQALSGRAEVAMNQSGIDMAGAPVATVAAWACVLVGVAVIGRPNRYTSIWETLASVVAVAAAAAAITWQTEAIPGDRWIVTLLFLAAGTTIAIAAFDGASLGVLFCGLVGIAALFAAALGVPAHSAVAAAAVGTGTALAWKGCPKGVSQRLERAGDGLFRVAEAAVLARFAWTLLALLRRLPFGRRRFLDSAIDAFLLKRSRDEYEFVHRLLRDYFALRELMPRLKQGAPARLQTIRSLGYQGEASLDMLLEFADDGEPQTRGAAIEALSHIASPAANARVAASASDPSPEVRLALLRSLTRLPVQRDIFLRLEPLAPREEVPVLLEVFPTGGPYWAVTGKEPGPLPRTPYLAINYVAAMGDAGLRNLLQALARRELRFAALVYLARLPRATVASRVLLDHLRDRNTQIRLFAVSALGVHGDRKAVEALYASLRDRDRGVREAAADAIADLAGHGIVAGRPASNSLRDPAPGSSG